MGESDTLIQQVKEPMCIYTVGANFSAINTKTNQEVTIAQNEQIYIFYSYVSAKKVDYVQFMRANDESDFTYDSENVIIGTNYRIDTKQNTITYQDADVPEIYINQNITLTPVKSGDSFQYTPNQGFKLVYEQLHVYDPVMKRTVDVYKVGEGTNKKEIYNFVDSLYTTSNVVTSFVTNGNSFDVYSDGMLQGWSNATYSTTKEEGLSKYQPLNVTTYPEIKPGDDLIRLGKLTDIKGFLEVKFQGASLASNNYSNMIFNSGIMDNASIIDHITSGQEFVFRIVKFISCIN